MVSYRSIDRAGNVEETRRMEVKTDRTPPTAMIGFDPEMRKIVVSGSDELSEVTIKREEERTRRSDSSATYMPDLYQKLWD